MNNDVFTFILVCFLLPNKISCFRSESVVQLTHDVCNESASLLRHVHSEELYIYIYICTMSCVCCLVCTTRYIHFVAALHTYMQRRVVPKHTFVPMPRCLFKQIVTVFDFLLSIYPTSHALHLPPLSPPPSPNPPFPTHFPPPHLQILPLPPTCCRW